METSSTFTGNGPGMPRHVTAGQTVTYTASGPGVVLRKITDAGVTSSVAMVSGSLVAPEAAVYQWECTAYAGTPITTSLTV